jgi:hypothetical protein
MLILFAATVFVADAYVSWCVFSMVAVVWWVVVIITVIYLIYKINSK